MDGARNFNSVIHFIRIPWTIRSEKDENMKHFTKRSLKFFPRYWLSMVTIPAAIYKFKVIVELSRDKFTHGYLGSFSACAWKQPREEAKYSLFIQNDIWYWITTSAISCWWHQTNKELSFTKKGPPISLSMTSSCNLLSISTSKVKSWCFINLL